MDIFLSDKDDNTFSLINNVRDEKKEPLKLVSIIGKCS